jgi:hypothetical protein
MSRRGSHPADPALLAAPPDERERRRRVVEHDPRAFEVDVAVDEVLLERLLAEVNRHEVFGEPRVEQRPQRAGFERPRWQ